MELDALVWARGVGDDEWRAAQVLESVVEGSQQFVTVRFEADGDTQRIEVDLSDLREPAVCIRSSEEGIDVHDLCTLTHLHQPAILSTLRERFEGERIYTYVGPILLALNPFRELGLYRDDILKRYAGHSVLGEPLAPHVYAIAGSSYRNMCDPPSRAAPRNQSILISGESGAGKTETTKIIMRFLARVSAEEGNSTAARVLQSNPILEALGNARTVRNDNSSRFGKFIEMAFRGGKLGGAVVRTFLLEKVRVARHDEGERTFHIFYMIFADAMKSRLLLTEPGDYRYLSQSSTWDRRDGVRDEDLMLQLRSALADMSFGGEQEDAMLRTVAAVLHLGNVLFGDDGSGEAALESEGAEALRACASLLRVQPAALEKALCVASVDVGAEHFESRVPAAQATHSRDALAKFIYQGLFEVTVQLLNGQLACDGAQSTIGLLDIFGFEVFETNSFEQFLINYANEALQNLFNRYVLEAEQKEYVAEGVDWQYVSFSDNAETLNLVERRPSGLLCLLDEQCMVPGGTDRRFADVVHRRLLPSDPDHCFATRAMKASHCFGLVHYAGRVSYDTHGFVEKNRDTVRPEVSSLLGSSECPQIRRMARLGAERDDAAAARVRGGRSRSCINAPSMSAKFRSQLADLIDRICKTTPHFVRCVKPNDTATALGFVQSRVSEQLRCGGVIEAVRVARAGYAVRMRHADFIRRYAYLLEAHRLGQLPSADGSGADRAQALLLAVLPLLAGEGSGSEGGEGEALARLAESGAQVGKTKIFLKERCYTKMEALRTAALAGAAVLLQRVVRGTRQRRAFLKLRSAALAAQRFVRGHQGRRRASDRRRLLAATVLQSRWRGRMARYWLRRQKVEGRAACIVASVVRMARSRRSFLRSRRGVLRLQAEYRRVQAKAVAAARREELRSVRHLQSQVRALEAEVERLRLENAALRREAAGHGDGGSTEPEAGGGALLGESADRAASPGASRRGTPLARRGRSPSVPRAKTLGDSRGASQTPGSTRGNRPRTPLGRVREIFGQYRSLSLDSPTPHRRRAPLSPDYEDDDELNDSLNMSLDSVAPLSPSADAAQLALAGLIVRIDGAFQREDTTTFSLMPSYFTVYRIVSIPKQGEAPIATVERRYNDFVWLNGILQAAIGDAKLPALPYKRYIGSSLDPNFVENRRSQLQEYLQAVHEMFFGENTNPLLSSIVASQALTTFLGAPLGMRNRRRRKGSGAPPLAGAPSPSARAVPPLRLVA